MKRAILLDKLRKMGYEDIAVMNFPSVLENVELETTDWYCATAKKGKAQQASIAHQTFLWYNVDESDTLRG